MHTHVECSSRRHWNRLIFFFLLWGKGLQDFFTVDYYVVDSEMTEGDEWGWLFQISQCGQIDVFMNLCLLLGNSLRVRMRSLELKIDRMERVECFGFVCGLRTVKEGSGCRQQMKKRHWHLLYVPFRMHSVRHVLDIPYCLLLMSIGRVWFCEAPCVGCVCVCDFSWREELRINGFEAYAWSDRWMLGVIEFL